MVHAEKFFSSMRYQVKIQLNIEKSSPYLHAKKKIPIYVCENTQRFYLYNTFALTYYLDYTTNI